MARKPRGPVAVPERPVPPRAAETLPALDQDIARSRAGHRDHYVTTCKVCLSGIYESQARHWSTKPMGLVHDWCRP
jgi:hypothetical protein